MAEYIEKNQLRLMTAEERERRSFDYELGWKACVEWIKALPAANVRENVPGAWIRVHDDVCYWSECSVCGERLPLNQWRQEWESPFCPNCGAEMRGGADE